MRDFKKLIVWQRSHQLTLKIYSITSKFPREELFGLVSQMRRSCSSIPTNIAEGCGRESIPDLQRFLTIARGSASELEYQILLSKDLKYLDEEQFVYFDKEINEIRRMIYGFSSKVKV